MNIPFHTLSVEMFVLIIPVIILIGLSLRYGKHVLVAYILALYPTFLIAINLPYAKTSTATINSFIVLAVFFAVYASIRNVTVGLFSFSLFKYVQSIILSISAIGLTVHIYADLVARGIASPFFMTSVKIVTSSAPFFIWLLVPIIALFLLGKE